MSVLELSWVSVLGGHSGAFEDAPQKFVAKVPATATVAPLVSTFSSRFTKKFDGDDWKDLVASVPSLLYQTFVYEASIALAVPQEAITDVQFRLGSLYVTFHVTHDEDISQEEMAHRIEEYPFREMWRLYNQRDGAPDGLDAALQRLKDVEMELKDKNHELEKERGDKEQKVNELKKQLQALQEELAGPVAEREQSLLQQLGKEQGARKKAEAQLKVVDDERKKLLEAVKQEKLRAEKSAQRHNDLIAAIIQENKKEKEAKEREHNEQMEVKDYIIENLKSQLRTHTNGSASPRNSIVDVDQTDEFNRLMERMEDMAAVLQRTQESENQARAQIQRLSDLLKESEEARQAESVSYDNNVAALTQQIHSYRDTKIAEDHERRAKEDRQRGRGPVSEALKENATIVRQYTTSLENLIVSLQDRLHAISEEYNNYLTEAEAGVSHERQILVEQDEDSKKTRQTFRSSSIALQKIYWGSREPEAQQIIQNLDAAASNAEKSSAAVRVVIAMLDSKARAFGDHRNWMEQQHRMMRELLTSLRDLNQRAFDRQRALMDEKVLKA
ncbi:conserved hypothetical protein [Leishmania infantum JPCM5]|uniref:Flagellar attachment zone protein 1 conserved domain-containing protein n=2 Tax=Leishmania infantum TaxID=5671 RepID=A4IA33_LEIIN|nr:conserved hypothetical protein [Leishmania infantum JPCM5]CAC9539363.1 hypothetical_protein_-_conserved [Leishmania infantum]CAM71689.1 conserved hypothetical protein [Leishmania infantum JPCM5]SUZ45624.1 hypothetical_protein_-_conserved [Leishmania infantum]|eukprot:XP_001468602.1 conserved hypothetical protein [Leishmania infantum JPCM5]